MNSDIVAVMVHLAEWCAVGRAPVGGRRGLAVARSLHGSHGRAGRRMTSGGGSSSKLSPELTLDTLLDPPLSEGSLVEVQPVLLRSNNHAGPHKPHERDDLVGSEAVAINQVGTNETAGSA